MSDPDPCDHSVWWGLIHFISFLTQTAIRTRSVSRTPSLKGLQRRPLAASRLGHFKSWSLAWSHRQAGNAVENTPCESVARRIKLQTGTQRPFEGTRKRPRSRSNGTGHIQGHCRIMSGLNVTFGRTRIKSRASPPRAVPVCPTFHPIRENIQ